MKITSKALLGTAVVGILSASVAAPTVAFATHHDKHKGHKKAKNACKGQKNACKGQKTAEGGDKKEGADAEHKE